MRPYGKITANAAVHNLLVPCGSNRNECVSLEMGPSIVEVIGWIMQHRQEVV